MATTQNKCTNNGWCRPRYKPGIKALGLIISISVTFGIISGCGNNGSKSGNETYKETAVEESSTNRTIKLPEANWKEEIPPEGIIASDSPDVTPSISPSQTPGKSDKPQETPGIIPQKGEMLDLSSLDKFSSKRYAWWISQNKKHNTPGIPAYAKKIIESHNGLYIGDTSKKAVYLTFDEGYENGYTARILDVLKANDTKALFFVTGPYVKTQPILIKRMLDEGHQVGNHTVNHPSLPAISNKSLESELLGLEKQYNALTGKKFSYMRPPRGEYSEKVLEAAKELGYKTVFWSFAYRDFEVDKQKGADNAHRIVMENIHNGAVILLHAVSKDNADALDRIIKDIKKEGYEILPFDL